MAEAPTTVWTYWENKPGRTRAPYLDLCLETIRLQAPPLEIRCVDETEAEMLIPGIDIERWRSLPAPNYRSDYLRSRLLQRYGGIWIDIDTVALAPLSQLLDAVDDTGVVSFGKELGRFFGGLCAARAGAPFVDMWVAEQDKVLDRQPDWSKLPYAGLAQDVTWHVARREPWNSLPVERVAPIPWYQWRRFFSRFESPSRLLAAAPLTVVLWNAVMSSRLRDRPAEELMRSRMLLSRLLRIGLGVTTPEQEEDIGTSLHRVAELRYARRVHAAELALRRLRRKGIQL